MIKATVGDALIVGGRITSIKTIDAGKILITIDHDKKVEFRNNGKKNRADIVKRLDLKKKRQDPGQCREEQGRPVLSLWMGYLPAGKCLCEKCFPFDRMYQ